MVNKDILIESKFKEINVFDFDDTLVKTKSHIYVTDFRGKSFSLTPQEYAVYEPKPGDSFDFSDFEDVRSPTLISHMILKLFYSIKTLGRQNVFILTARGAGEPIRKFLEGIGIMGADVVALGDSNPFAKSAVIKDEILRRGVNIVKFFDDSPKNIMAVRSLRKDPSIPSDVKIIAIRVGE